MADRQQQFAAHVNELLQRSKNITASTARSVFSMLEDLRKEVISRIATAPQGGYTAWQLDNLLREIDRNQKEFARIAAREVSAAQEKQFGIGVELVDAPLNTAGMGTMLTGLPRKNLVIAQGYSARLITSITGEYRTRIDLELRRAMLGGQEIGGVVDRVSQLLDGETGRAETVVFTELNRMQSVATQSRLEQLSERMKDHGREDVVRKEWRHFMVGAPRLGHVALDGVSVPVNEPFTVETYADANGQVVAAEMLMYPRDPAGSARNTINCHCRVVPAVKIPERANVPRIGRLEIVPA